MVATLADFMNELRKLYRDACDKTGSYCELFHRVRTYELKEVYEITQRQTSVD